MTKTLDGMCGKCKREKTVKQTQEWENKCMEDITPIKYKIQNIFANITEHGKLDFSKSEYRAMEDLEKLFSSQKQEMMENIERAERNAIDESIKKFRVYKYDYMEGVFMMKFSLLDILSALEKDGKND